MDKHPCNDEAYWLFHNGPDVEVPDEKEPEDNIPDAVADVVSIRHGGAALDGSDGWSVVMLHSSDGDPLLAIRLAHPLHDVDQARRLANAILSEIEIEERERAGDF